VCDVVAMGKRNRSKRFDDATHEYVSGYTGIVQRAGVNSTATEVTVHKESNTVRVVPGRAPEALRKLCEEMLPDQPGEAEIAANEYWHDAADGQFQSVPSRADKQRRAEERRREREERGETGPRLPIFAYYQRRDEGPRIWRHESEVYSVFATSKPPATRTPVQVEPVVVPPPAPTDEVWESLATSAAQAGVQPASRPSEESWEVVQPQAVVHANQEVAHVQTEFARPHAGVPSHGFVEDVKPAPRQPARQPPQSSHSQSFSCNKSTYDWLSRLGFLQGVLEKCGCSAGQFRDGELDLFGPTALDVATAALGLETHAKYIGVHQELEMGGVSMG